MSDTPIADMVETMLAAAVPAPAVVLAVRTAEITRDASRYASRSVTVLNRSKAAERAARYREKRKQNQQLAKANDVASPGAQQRDERRDASRHNVTQRCDEKKDSEQEFDQGRKKEVVARARGTRLPPDWQPDEALCQFAREHGLDPAALTPEFVDYWSAVPGQRGLKLDWAATFRNRVRDVASGKVRSRAFRPQAENLRHFAARMRNGNAATHDQSPPGESWPVIDGELDLSGGGLQRGPGGG